MRVRLTLAALMLLALAIPAMSQETPPAAECCQNSITGQSVPRLTHTCAELGAGWVDSAGPCVPVETEPSWWDAVLAWADGKVLYNPDANTIAKILAWLASLTAVVQAIKKLIEGSGKWAWLLKLIPQWAKIADFLAHGWGPVALNAILTGGVMLTAALQSGGLTAGEVLRILIAIVGTDLLYKLARVIFPKDVPAT